MRIVRDDGGGSFDTVRHLLEAAHKIHVLNNMDKYAKKGVEALAEATPKDTGKTASSWTYTIEQSPVPTIQWSNTNTVDDWFNVAKGLQYGHGTRNGGWVEGVDYINPAIQPIMDKISDVVWTNVVES